jgi:gamma-glutamyltranspeptidase / glutathione hydrolase
MTYDFPYGSRRMPVMAKNVVATSQPLAAQAGLRMLLQGGNAVDAALATAICLTVVEPTSNGIGSDAFCILWDGQKLHGLNASGRSPKTMSPEHFPGRSEMPMDGWDSVTVPGCVSAWVELSKTFGKLAFEKLFEPAIAYARDGFLVSPITAASWQEQANHFKKFPEFVKGFMPNGRAPTAGEVFKYPEQAKTLELIAATKGEAFYRGELTEQIIADAKKHNALMHEEDFGNHKAEWVGTVSQAYKSQAYKSQAYNDVELHEIPPNGQGLASLIALGILKHHDIAQYQVDSADSLHLQIEAMKLALADAYRYIADASSMEINPTDLLEPTYLAERATLINMKHASNFKHGIPKGKSTVYLTAADASGMMVSFIQSNYYGFGSGIVIPGTGIALQNRGYGFSLQKGHPNEVAGGKRPFHTIIPAFVTRQGLPLMSFGVMGGPMQAQGHLQMVLRMFDYGQNPQTASDAPRWRVSSGLDISFETGHATNVLDNLQARGHHITLSDPTGFGGAQLIYKAQNGYSAASDHRKDGQALGY